MLSTVHLYLEEGIKRWMEHLLRPIHEAFIFVRFICILSQVIPFQTNYHIRSRNCTNLTLTLLFFDRMFTRRISLLNILNILANNKELFEWKTARYVYLLPHAYIIHYYILSTILFHYIPFFHYYPMHITKFIIHFNEISINCLIATHFMEKSINYLNSYYR